MITLYAGDPGDIQVRIDAAPDAIVNEVTSSKIVDPLNDPIKPKPKGSSRGAESGEVIGEVSGEVRGEVAPSMVERILQMLEISELRSAEIAHRFGWKKAYGSLALRLKQMLEDKIIAYTIPSKPRSRLQKYRLTTKGRALVAEKKKAKVAK